MTFTFGFQAETHAVLTKLRLDTEQKLALRVPKCEASLTKPCTMLSDDPVDIQTPRFLVDMLSHIKGTVSVSGSAVHTEWLPLSPGQLRSG